ncbi:DUF58 domain-containing protein [Ferrimonas marina]|uniref:Uncharacterized conserved protein, DUF58 family, contains vWF domain n=1 Tax=Ferrimonas marina TaxID=299255 RepID=A0A1M5R7C3_9GAMM|nr:hypothetical protein [Ferrimonas marina]SHH21970.1 Uncharacterized conserved protein, DUF58 family, contains vWF domain [Ferrimonas marina]
MKPGTLGQRWWLGWLRRRCPAQSSQGLSHRSVFVLPTGNGVYFLAMCLVLFLLGTNYQNNLVLVLSFLLFSLFISALFIGFRNLAGLQIAATEVSPCHAGALARFELSLSSQVKRYDLHLAYPLGQPRHIAVLDQAMLRCAMTVPTAQRGHFQPGRLKLQSLYPLGLCRFWSQLDLDQHCWIWPQPIPGPVKRLSTGSGGLAAQGELDGTLERWQPGHGLGRVAWKQLAQSGRWHAKTLAQPSDGGQLTLEPTLPLESALSHLCHALLAHHQRGESLQLVLGQRSWPGSEPHQLQDCLNRLAHYPAEPGP